MHTYTQHNQGLVDDTPTKMYIYTTCYALTAAIFITQNEYFTDIKNLLSTVFSFQELSTCKSHISVD